MQAVRGVQGTLLPRWLKRGFMFGRPLVAILSENFLKFFGSIWHFYEVKVAKNLSR